MPSKISPEMMSEWVESLITQELRTHFASQITLLKESMAEAYAPYEPQRTQEILANLNGAQDTWELALEALDGDWSYFDEEIEDEQIGD